MKNLKTYLLAIGLTFAVSCEKQEIPTTEESEVIGNQNLFTKRSCSTTEKVQKSLKSNPKLALKMDEIERFTENFSEDPTKAPVLTIPVVVNVVYKTNGQYIGDARIRSQIDALNKDFSKKNNDINKVPNLFKNRATNVQVKFKLEKIRRRKTNRNTFGDSEGMKFNNSGGINAYKPRTHLNIWVCNIDALGFAYLPGSAPSVGYDGVVVHYRAFGTFGGNLYPEYNKGRTTTHEVGHWLNLEHIWGPESGGSNDPFKCYKDDKVADTPKSFEPYFGCPAFPSKSCGTTDMTMNYMDYSDDRCMYMFTHGQKNRMRAALNGPRSRYKQ